MLLEYLGWTEAAQLIHQALPRTLRPASPPTTWPGCCPAAKEVSCSAFGQGLIEHM